MAPRTPRVTPGRTPFGKVSLTPNSIQAASTPSQKSPTSFPLIFQVEKATPAVSVPSCAADSDTRNTNECVKIGENRRLCWAIMRTEYVEMCELFLVLAAAPLQIHGRNLNIGPGEYWCGRSLSLSQSALMHCPV